MKAAIFNGKGSILVEERPKPSVNESTDAVVGDGAVGLSGVLASTLLGAERIIVLGSTHEDRHALAREWGATDIISVRGDEAVAQLKSLTDGFGADAVLECVGTDASSDTAFAVAAAGAVVGRVGVPHDVEIDGETTFYRNVGMRGGPAPAHAYQPELLKQDQRARRTRS